MTATVHDINGTILHPAEAERRQAFRQESLTIQAMASFIEGQVSMTETQQNLTRALRFLGSNAGEL